MNNIETNEPQIENSQQKQGENSQKQIAGAIILAAVIIGGAILLKGNRPPVAPVPVAGNGINNVENIELKPVSKEDHIKGDIKAKVIVVEYSDLECPFCKVFHKTMHQIVKTNKDVAWVYRHYPIPPLHAKAFKESEATECAWEQGGNTAFWQYTDKIFEITTSNDGLDPLELPKIAESLGLNVNNFNDCLTSEKFRGKILNEVENGTKAGVRGTPKSFILKNGKVVDTINGAEPSGAVTAKIDAALK